MLNIFQVTNSINNYVPKVFKRDNIFLSPIFTPKHILSKFPKTVIFCGAEDPLYGNSEIFALKLFENNVDVKLFTLPDIGHGFMAFYLPMNYGIQEIESIIEYLIMTIENFIKKEEIDKNLSSSSSSDIN